MNLCSAMNQELLIYLEVIAQQHPVKRTDVVGKFYIADVQFAWLNLPFSSTLELKKELLKAYGRLKSDSHAVTRPKSLFNWMMKNVPNEGNVKLLQENLIALVQLAIVNGAGFIPYS